jgi:hypothetical protein
MGLSQSHLDLKIAPFTFTNRGTIMEKPTNIYDFFNKMSEADFNNRFLELSKRDEFSAAASLTATAEDITLVKEQLVQAGVNEDWVNNDKLFGAIIRHITSRIFKKKDT